MGSFCLASLFRTIIYWSCCSGTTWWYLSLFSRILDPHTLHKLSFISDILTVQFVNCDFVVQFCRCDIYCMFHNPGGGIPRLWLVLRFFPSPSPNILISFVNPASTRVSACWGQQRPPECLIHRKQNRRRRRVHAHARILVKHESS